MLDKAAGLSNVCQVLDRMLTKLHAKGHRCAIFTQYKGMVEVLTLYCELKGKRSQALRLGGVGGAVMVVLLLRSGLKYFSLFSL